MELRNGRRQFARTVMDGKKTRQIGASLGKTIGWKDKEAEDNEVKGEEEKGEVEKEEEEEEERNEEEGEKVGKKDEEDEGSKKKIK